MPLLIGNWLSEENGLEPCYNSRGSVFDPDADGFRLPTEAEWEFAARGGNLSQGFLYAGSNNPGEVAWFGFLDDQAKPIGTKLPNELGLYDMSGNVWEWCWDWYGRDYYEISSGQDPLGAPRQIGPYQYFGNKVRRGGSYIEDSDYTRITSRSFDGPERQDMACGVRLVRNAD